MKVDGTTYERIAASAPVNAQAARQMGKGEVFKAKAKLHDFYEVRPEMRPVTPEMINENFADLTGHQYGRLTVIGLAKKRGYNGARWVARCACGNYVTRSGKAILGGNGDRCGPCSYTQSLREL